jgi:hypothetical protein
MHLTQKPHPRLYVTAAQLARLRERASLPGLGRAEREVARLAATFVRRVGFEYPRNVHNEHLLRARHAQLRVVTLLVRYFQTGDRPFRRSAIAHIRAIGAWEYWSWITWRVGNPDPNATFDLSCGENSATLAIAYDWLHGELSSQERAMFVQIARTRSLVPYLRHTGGRKPIWWFRHAECNWNTVCNGGAGMLALAMSEELAEARRVLARVEEGVRPFMDTLRKTDGAWAEGLGYWNYGMRYAFLYLLSHENATGRKHPLLHRAATRATLRFPLEFAPNGVPCGFGDANAWRPLPFHYEAARRLGPPDVIAKLDAHRSSEPQRESFWPNDAELLLLHPRTDGRPPKPATDVVKLYRGQNWGILADRLPAPRLYLAVRGGATDGPHSHRDLLSFHAVVGDEPLITNLGILQYLDTTFGPRRYELFETMPASKNTILINGVGVTGNSRVESGVVEMGPLRGIRMDASAAMGLMRDGAAATFCGRLFVLLPGPAALIVDRAELPHPGRIETRFHTHAGPRLLAGGADLIGRRERMRLAFACNVPATLHRSMASCTTPGRPVHVLRWCTDAQHTDMTMATLLSPGRGPCRLSLRATGRSILVRGKIARRSFGMTLTRRLGA